MAYVFVSKLVANCSIQLTQSRCLNELNMCTDCTCDQANHAGYLCENLMPSYEYYRAMCEKYLDMVGLCVGAAANVLLLLTLMQPLFSEGLTFLYMRIIAVIGLLQALWHLIRKIFMYFGFDKDYYNYGMVVYFGIGIYVADWIKLLVSSLSMFLAFDRLLCVVVPIFYSRINSRRFIIVTCLISILISVLALLDVAGTSRVDQYTDGTFDFRVGFYLPKIRPIPRLILAIRLFQIALMNSVAAVVVISLRLRLRRLRKMLMTDSSLNELKKTKNLCRFQILESIQITVDLFFVCFYELISIFPIPAAPQLTPHTYTQYLALYPYLIIVLFASLFRYAAFQLSQILLFFLYLFFSKMFRKGFGDVFRSLFSRSNQISTHNANSNYGRPSLQAGPIIKK